MNQSVSTTRVTKRRRGWWWKLPLALLVVLIVVVVLLPTFVSWGLGHGIIRGAIEERVNGAVALGKVDASWFGDQTVRGFTITAADGTKAVDVTATLHASLLDLLFGTIDTYEVALAGELNGEIREDDTISFAELYKPAPPNPAALPTSPTSRGAAPNVLVNINALHLALRDQKTNETFEFKDIKGSLDLKPGGASRASLEGTSIAGGETGSILLEADADGAIDRTGAFTPAGASAQIAMRLQGVPALLTSTPTLIHLLEIQADSADLTQRIELTMQGKAQVEGAEPSSLSGAVTIDNPFDATGGVTVSLAGITGTVSGTRVPSALLQPVLAAGSPIRLERDLGDVVDVEATFSAGETKQVNVLAYADAARLELAGTIDTSNRSFNADRVLLSATVDPALARALADIELDQPGQVRAEFSRLSIPAMIGGAPLNFADVALTGRVAIENAVHVTISGETPRTVHVRNAVVNVESESLGTLVRATGSAAVDELTVEFDESVKNLIGPDGGIAFATLVPEGYVRVAGITDTTVQAFTPGIADLVITNKVLPATAELRTQPTDAGWSADLAISGNKLEGMINAERTGETLVAQFNLDMRVSPALVAFMQSEGESPVELLGPAQLSLVSEPMDFPAAQLGEIDLASQPIVMTGTLTEATFANVPALDEPVRVTGFDALLTWRRQPERWYGADGSATLLLAADNTPLSDVRFDVSAAAVEGEMVPTGMVALSGLSMAALERASGRGIGAFEGYVGERGDVRLMLDREGDTIYSTVDASLSNLQGTFAASLSPEMLTLTADTSKFVLSQAGLNRFLARAAPDDAGDSTADGTVQSLTALTDLPLNANVRSMRIPRNVLTADPIDPADVEIDIALTGGPVSFTEPSLGTLTSESIAASITSSDLSDGVKFDVDVIARPSDADGPSAGAEPTQIQMAGALANLLDAQSRVSTESAKLDMTAKATRVPTALVDAAGAFKGLLVAALGAQVQATATAEQFSLDTGKLTTRLEASNGWMEGILKGREGLLQLSVNNPLRAELEITPALRDRLLQKIHPLLADVRTTEQPLRVLVPNASMPVNGDVSKLNARIEITVGKVELDSGSTTLFLMRLFDTGRGSTIPGSIEPIVATITNGVLTYEKFAVHIDKYRMDYSGTIDLNTGAVFLKTELPLEALATSIEELRGVASDIVVPIVTRGTFGSLKTEIDPSFSIAEEAIKGGLRGALEDILGGDEENEDGEDEPKAEDQVKDILEKLLRGSGKKDAPDEKQGNSSPRRRQ